MFCRGANNLALSVEGVSKCYRFYARPQHRLWQALWLGRRCYFEEAWALRDVSFTVAQGEAVGIVGRNGAGKSTLLQIIAATLAPTHGTVQVNGRVAALLQLGAGFHPEYSGRDNVYLNGAILGFDRSRIDELFEDIAAFADIGVYMERPVQTYSSGMYARLAFAVATAVEPDILIVDEILAVGDLLFQQKCISRIQQMRDRGLTLLFVSQSAAQVKSLCEHGLLLQNGRQCFYGDAEECTNLYLAQLRTEANREQHSSSSEASKDAPIIRRQTKGLTRYGTQEVRITNVRVLNDKGKPARVFRFGERIRIEVRYRSTIETDDVNVSYLIRDDTGIDLTGTMTNDEGVSLPPVCPKGTGGVLFSFANHLRPGNFGISVAITRINKHDPRRPLLFDHVDGVEAFTVLPEPERPVHYKFHSAIEVKIL